LKVLKKDAAAVVFSADIRLDADPSFLARRRIRVGPVTNSIIAAQGLAKFSQGISVRPIFSSSIHLFTPGSAHASLTSFFS
jgi:hypothetical protein